ncbi:MAG: hypothetical protein WDA14_10570 [Sphaerochaetaceae bacterium]|nr:hypothetical protein [Sphaerochaetaceae bacterium]
MITCLIKVCDHSEKHHHMENSSSQLWFSSKRLNDAKASLPQSSNISSQDVLTPFIIYKNRTIVFSAER